MAPYGVATNVYGRGMTITHHFATRGEAKAFCKPYLPGAAIVCKFYDGSWHRSYWQ